MIGRCCCTFVVFVFVVNSKLLKKLDCKLLKGDTYLKEENEVLEFEKRESGKGGTVRKREWERGKSMPMCFRLK